LTYHEALDLREAGLNTIEIEHYDSEKFFVEAMYENLSHYIDKNIIFKSNSMKSPFEII
jgi:putative NIF3 family GTP cyclohydrolase 1 type 2